MVVEESAAFGSPQAEHDSASNAAHAADVNLSMVDRDMILLVRVHMGIPICLMGLVIAEVNLIGAIWRISVRMERRAVPMHPPAIR